MKINSIEVTPPIASVLGYDITGANNKELVTVVRRKVTLEEVIMTIQDFNDMNSKVQSEEHDEYWNHLNWEDAQTHDYNLEETDYTAFAGDVTSFTDDCVAFIYPNINWSKSYDTVFVNEETICPIQS
jgi:hypothetical protein